MPVSDTTHLSYVHLGTGALVDNTVIVVSPVKVTHKSLSLLVQVALDPGPWDVPWCLLELVLGLPLSLTMTDSSS